LAAFPGLDVHFSFTCPQNFCSFFFLLGQLLGALLPPPLSVFPPTLSFAKTTFLSAWWLSHCMWPDPFLVSSSYLMLPPIQLLLESVFLSSCFPGIASWIGKGPHLCFFLPPTPSFVGYPPIFCFFFSRWFTNNVPLRGDKLC